MLLANNILKLDTVVTLKLISGEELIGKLKSQEGLSYRIENPMKVVITPTGMGLAPYLMTVGPDGKGTYDIFKSAVMIITDTHSEIATQYVLQHNNLVKASSLPAGLTK